MQKWIQPPAFLDHGLHRILFRIGWRSFTWWKKPPKCLSILVWIAGYWNSLLTSRNPKIFNSLPNFWSTVQRKWSRFEHMQTVIQTSRRVDSFCMKRLRTLNSYQIFKIKNKNKKPIAYPIVRYHTHADPIWPDGTLKISRKIIRRRHADQIKTGGFRTFQYFILHCFTCRPTDSTVSEDAGIELRTVDATLAKASDALTTRL